MKHRIRLTESQLHDIIKESVIKILNEDSVNEVSLKHLAAAGAIGAASLFGGNSQAHAQTNGKFMPAGNTQQTEYRQNADGNLQIPLKQLIKIFKKAYKDRNANPEVWLKNKSAYSAVTPDGKMSLIGTLAAAIGKNPWDAILQKYNQEEYNKSLFTMSSDDFSI